MRDKKSAMESRAVVVALALSLPLALYGIPYAYAATSSSYEVLGNSQAISAGALGASTATCDSGDYVTGGGWSIDPLIAGGGGNDFIISAGAGSGTVNLNGWFVETHNLRSSSETLQAIAMCQKPIVVAGVTVPEFGSLYVAIALGALVYFLLSRQLAGRRAMLPQGTAQG
jgi:hypothetical protein